jgi:WD40 repeat protein
LDKIQFVPRTHYFFSASKDGYLKYWDADTFEHVLTLEGHQSEIWAMCVSSQGDFVVTGSHDRSIRVSGLLLLFFSLLKNSFSFFLYFFILWLSLTLALLFEFVFQSKGDLLLILIE